MKRYNVEQNSIIAQWFTNHEKTKEWNQHVGLYDKWRALVGDLVNMHV